MNVRSLFSKGLRLLPIVLLLVPWLNGSSSFAAFRDAGPVLPAGSLFDSGPLFSDFDGDNKLDQATLSSSPGFKHIHVALGKSSWSSLSFAWNESDRGRLVSGDIDDDGDIDLVWVSQNAEKVIAWLDDGAGHFSIGRDIELNLGRIQSLLRDEAPRFGGDPDTAQLEAVFAGTSLVVLPGAFRYQPYLRAQSSLIDTGTSAICAGCFSTAKPRGPPSKIF